METWLASWQIILLGMGRVAAMVIQAPVIGGRNVPREVKVAVVLVLTAVCLGWPSVPAGTADLNSLHFAGLLLKECAVGFLLGFSVTLVLFVCQAAGELVGFQMMFTVGETIMPLTSQRGSMTGNFFYLFAILVFISIDGHHWLIKALYQSFRTLPVLAMPHSFGSVQIWTQLTGRLFGQGLQLALPIVVTLFITNLMLGMIAKTMPQLNIFVVGMPVQVMVALVVLVISIPQLLLAEQGMFRGWTRDLFHLLRLMAPQ